MSQEQIRPLCLKVFGPNYADGFTPIAESLKRTCRSTLDSLNLYTTSENEAKNFYRHYRNCCWRNNAKHTISHQLLHRGLAFGILTLLYVSTISFDWGLKNATVTVTAAIPSAPGNHSQNCYHQQPKGRVGSDFILASNDLLV